MGLLFHEKSMSSNTLLVRVEWWFVQFVQYLRILFRKTRKSRQESYELVLPSVLPYCTVRTFYLVQYVHLCVNTYLPYWLGCTLLRTRRLSISSGRVSHTQIHHGSVECRCVMLSQ